MSPLLGFYQRTLQQADFTYPWHEFVSHYLHAGTGDTIQAEGLKSYSLALDLSTPKECFLFFRQFLSLALISSKSKPSFSLEALFDHAENYPFWRDSPLAKLYFNLCSKVCMRPSECESPPLLPVSEAEEMWKGGSTLKLQEGAEYALLTGLLGLWEDNHELQMLSLTQAEWLLSLLDHRYHPFYSLGSREGSGDLPSVLSLNFVLFSLCERLTKADKWRRGAQSQLGYLKGIASIKPIDLPLLPPLLYHLLEELDPGLSFCSEETELSFSPCVRWGSEKSSFTLTFNGRNSGMGAFHKDRVKVVNFGPWAAPLGECGGFGIKGSNRAVTLQDSSSRCVKGWTRLQPTSLFPDTWLSVEAKEEEEVIQLSVTPTPLTEDGSLSFAFFVRCDEAQVGSHRFLPATMRHYVGESTSVTFFSGKEKIEISVPQKRELELIPLAGGKHFWQANFLLAFSLSESNSSLMCSIG